MANDFSPRHGGIREIRLQNLLPRVFVGEKVPDSGVWRTSVSFRKGEFYTVEAASGAGKSSLCAFIYELQRT